MEKDLENEKWFVGRQSDTMTAVENHILRAQVNELRAAVEELLELIMNGGGSTARAIDKARNLLLRIRPN